MSIFNRNKEVIEEVPELERYYAERRTSSAWSWVMALVTMILTVLIIIGLFYGGRWVYRELNTDEATTTPTTQTTPTVNAPQNPPAGNQNNAQTGGTLPAGESESSNSGSAESSAQSTNQSTSQTQPTQTTTTANNNLPNSGPGETFAVALLAFAIAYIYRLYKIAKKSV